MLSIAGSVRGLLDPEGEGTSGTVYSGKGRLIPEILNLKTGRDFVGSKIFHRQCNTDLTRKTFSSRAQECLPSFLQDGIIIATTRQ